MSPKVESGLHMRLKGLEQHDSRAGTVALKQVGKLVLGIVLPISLVAIAAAIIFAVLFFKYKRRYAVSLSSFQLDSPGS